MLPAMKMGLYRWSIYTYELCHLKFLISIFSFDTYNWSFLLAFLQWTLKSFFMLSIRNWNVRKKSNKRLAFIKHSSDFKKKHWRQWRRPLTVNHHLFLKKENMEKQASFQWTPSLGLGVLETLWNETLCYIFLLVRCFEKVCGLFGWWDTLPS